jgi:hypothetical protein
MTICQNDRYTLQTIIYIGYDKCFDMPLFVTFCSKIAHNLKNVTIQSKTFYTKNRFGANTWQKIAQHK